MNPLLITAIVLTSIAAYLTAGYYTGRTFARRSWKIATGDSDKRREGFAKSALLCGGTPWPLTVWWLLGTGLCRRSNYSLVEHLIPEERAKADDRRQTHMEAEIARLEREIKNSR